MVIYFRKWQVYKNWVFDGTR